MKRKLTSMAAGLMLLTALVAGCNSEDLAPEPEETVVIEAQEIKEPEPEEPADPSPELECFFPYWERGMGIEVSNDGFIAYMQDGKSRILG